LRFLFRFRYLQSCPAVFHPSAKGKYWLDPPNEGTPIFEGDSADYGSKLKHRSGCNLVGIGSPKNHLIDYEKKSSGFLRPAHRVTPPLPPVGPKLGPSVRRLLPEVNKILSSLLIEDFNRISSVWANCTYSGKILSHLQIQPTTSVYWGGSPGEFILKSLKVKIRNVTKPSQHRKRGGKTPIPSSPNASL